MFKKLGLTVDTPSRMDVIRPDKEQKIEGAWIDVLSFDSTEMQQSMAEYDRKHVGAVADPQSRSYHLAGMAITGWHLVDFDGVPIDVPFTRSHALELMRSPATRWLQSQVFMHGIIRGNYMPSGVLSS